MTGKEIIERISGNGLFFEDDCGNLYHAKMIEVTTPDEDIYLMTPEDFATVFPGPLTILHQQPLNPNE